MWLRFGGDRVPSLAAWDEESPNCGRHNGLRCSVQGTVLDNVQAEQSDGKCNRKKTALRRVRKDESKGKGEMVR